MLRELYVAMGQAKIEKHVKRQSKGIHSKKVRDEWDNYGMPVVLSLNEFFKHYKKVVSGKIRPFELMKQPGSNKSTYYRYVIRLLQFLKVVLS